MTDHLHPAFASNPMILMADLGLRALDMTMSSSHRLCDGVDQLTRAAASQPARQRSGPSFAGVGDIAALTSSSVASSANTALKAHNLDVMTQAWLHWFAAMGAVTSLGARRGLRAPVGIKETTK
jgi:hypothetical protein